MPKHFPLNLSLNSIVYKIINGLDDFVQCFTCLRRKGFRCKTDWLTWGMVLLKSYWVVAWRCSFSVLDVPGTCKRGRQIMLSWQFLLARRSSFQSPKLPLFLLKCVNNLYGVNKYPTESELGSDESQDQRSQTLNMCSFANTYWDVRYLQNAFAQTLESHGKKIMETNRQQLDNTLIDHT